MKTSIFLWLLVSVVFPSLVLSQTVPTASPARLQPQDPSSTMKADIVSFHVETKGDGALHITYSDGSEVKIPKEKGDFVIDEKALPQEDFSDIQVADDRQHIGWLASYMICQQNYPCNAVLVIYQSGKQPISISPESGIPWRWKFLEGGRKIVIQFGFPHGDIAGAYTLHDTETGRDLGSYSENEKEAPHWVQELRRSEAAGSDNASISSAVEANNAFGLDLYRQLAAQNEGKNLFFSSYSLLSALTMAAEGARDHTAKEMKAVMHLPEDLDTAHKGLLLLNTRYGPQRDPQKDKLNAEIEKLEKERKIIAQKVILLEEQNAQYFWKERRGEQVDEEHYRERREQLWQTRRREWDIVGRINKLLNEIDLTQTTIANALWGETTYPFRQTYIDRVSKFYGTGALRSADFKGASEVERVRINAWVEEITRDRIKDLLPPGSLNRDTRLVLANAIYFKGQWVKPFDKEKTQTEDFTLASGQKVKVSMMKETMERARYGAFNADGSFFNTPGSLRPGDTTPPYPGEGGFSIIELPYRGGKLAMVILVPNSPTGLGAIEKQLDAKNLDGWIDLLKWRKVYVCVPKFTSETEYTMNGTLKALGMKSAFTMPSLPGGANFMGMADSQNRDEQFYISAVQHKAFVAVDEKGTEAAAATAAVAYLQGMGYSGPFTPVFRADRPFLFLIRDVKTGCVLFAGRIMKP